MLEHTGPVLWKKRSVGETSKAFEFYDPARAVDGSVLVPAEINELEIALDQIVQAGFGKVRERTREHPAYKEAWRDNQPQKMFLMNYSLLFKCPDEARLEMIIDPEWIMMRNDQHLNANVHDVRLGKKL